ncbi:AraC family transcriptional regulator [Paenibacillus sp. 598K]|uniref:AraC family transcriptional regulator n=1 Tax=Paenibacillus sp. 598K TaxID=1117987 RepID=UPI000FFA0FA9|nr:AraC family transcriptional regulator [Paenibacillus sp. 598K]GBF72446.1 AraC family transcriptional regulator [Paenibacillus sp. 598K]
MKKSSDTYLGKYFFEHFPVYINRATESFDTFLHDHDFYEFAYIAEGSGFHHVGDDIHKVIKGQLCFIPIGIPHVFRPQSTNAAKHRLIVYNCVFPARVLAKLAEFVTDEACRSFIVALMNDAVDYFVLPDEEDTIEKLFLAMHREYTLIHAGAIDYIHTLLVQLLLTVQRRRSVEGGAASKTPVSFHRLLQYLDRHCTEPLTLASLAEASGWSARHLQRLFLRHTEQPFLRYLQHLRIQRSCQLLRDTPEKVSAIAESVGYKDIGTFLALFKRSVGMTPTQYRNSKSQ